MRTQKQLLEIHNSLKTILKGLISKGYKFEVSLSMARRIIRTDYNTVDVKLFKETLPQTILDDIVHLMIDPSSTSKKVYYEVIDNIFAASRLKTAMKDDKNFTKVQRLCLLVEINYLHFYVNLSQIKICKYLEQHNIVGITDLDEIAYSKEINRYIQLAKKIKTTTDNILPEQYTVS